MREDGGERAKVRRGGGVGENRKTGSRRGWEEGREGEEGERRRRRDRRKKKEGKGKEEGKSVGREVN